MNSHYAALIDAKEMTELLMSKGADINAKDLLSQIIEIL